MSADANRPMTQEELLEEAKETELLNIESLKKFQQVNTWPSFRRIFTDSGEFLSYLPSHMCTHSVHMYSISRRTSSKA
jgi:hypothetical protein